MTYFFETYGCQTCRKQVHRDMPEAPESCAERISRAERKENAIPEETGRKQEYDILF